MNVGYGTYKTAASTARISLASSRQRCCANTVTSGTDHVRVRRQLRQRKDLGLPGLTSTRSVRPSSGSLMCATSFITDRASP